MSNSDARLDIGLGRHPVPRERRPSSKFRIALLGDFSGRWSRKIEPEPDFADRKPLSVDPDNFEEVMRQMDIQVPIGPDLLRLSDLDHFHPDHLYKEVPLLQSLRIIRAEFPIGEEPVPAKPGASLSFLDQIAEATPEPQPSGPLKRPVSDLFDQAIRTIANRHATPKADPRMEEVAAQIDTATTEALRTILSHPALQNLEAAWRSVFFVMRHLEISTDLEISLIDVSRPELFADLSTSDLESSGLYRLLVKEAAASPWSVIAGLYTFAPTERDCAALARIGTIAAAARAPFISAIDPTLFGCKSIVETPDPDDWDQPLDPANRQAWDRLRAAPQSSWLGLVMPRFLLRLPYGRKTAPIESFKFEEMPDPPDHASYLWGNPAVACAILLGQAYQRNGWEMRPGSVNRLDEVPAHVHGNDDVTPPAEIWITEKFAERMLDEGVMPLASVKHSDAVQLVRVQSIANPTKPLSGPWS